MLFLRGLQLLVELCDLGVLALAAARLRLLLGVSLLLTLHLPLRQRRLRALPTVRLRGCRPEVHQSPNAVLLSTRRLDSVLDYVPGDGTLTAQVGAPMEDLASCVAEGGHSLTPQLCGAADSSLGGALGAGRSGLDRYKYGPLRHHVLGLRVALSDGTLAGSGGKLVKNVTGFDLHRLYTGSRGTLCVLLEASLRLFPAPEGSFHFELEGPSAAELLRHIEPIRTTELGIRALALENHSERWTLHANVVSLADCAAESRREAMELLEDARVHENEAAELAFTRLRELEQGTGWPQFQVQCMPALLDVVLNELDELRTGARYLVETASGSIQVHDPELNELSGEEQALILGGLQQQLAQHGAIVTPREVELEVHRSLAHTPATQPALQWMLTIQNRLDRQGMLRSPIYPGRT